MGRGLDALDIQIAFTGARAAQTQHRQSRMSMVDINRYDRVQVNLIFDWPNAKVRHYIEMQPESRKHPLPLETVMVGGALADKKIECGLHV